MQRNNTTNQLQAIPFAELRAGDSVLVWDNSEGREVWLVIADIFERHGSHMMRAEGTNYYFDLNLAVNFIKGRDDDDDPPPPVSVIQGERGSIGIFGVTPDCQRCGQASGQLFNIGTAKVCGGCRSKETEAAA